MGRAFALHAANPGLIPGTHMPNRSEPECRGRNKSWAPPGVSPAPLKKKKKEKEMSRCVTNERCLPVDLKLNEIMSPISLCRPCFSSNFLLQPFLPTICYPLLVAVLTVPVNWVLIRTTISGTVMMKIKLSVLYSLQWSYLYVKCSFVKPSK